MAAYIKTGWGLKCLLSPKISVYPEEWVELDKQAEPLEERLYVLRTMRYDTCKPHPYLEEIRELRKKLSRIDSQMRDILMQANPEYDKYWHGDTHE